jgi:hypothetical protein
MRSSLAAQGLIQYAAFFEAVYLHIPDIRKSVSLTADEALGIVDHGVRQLAAPIAEATASVEAGWLIPAIPITRKRSEPIWFVVGACVEKDDLEKETECGFL